MHMSLLIECWKNPAFGAEGRHAAPQATKELNNVKLQVRTTFENKNLKIY